MISDGIETTPKEVHIPLEKNNLMNWDYMICVVMYGNGLKHQHIRMHPTLNQMAIFSFAEAGVGGMKIKTAVYHDAMHQTALRKQVD